MIEGGIVWKKKLFKFEESLEERCELFMGAMEKGLNYFKRAREKGVNYLWEPWRKV